MSKFYVIGLTGKKGAGKDSAAAIVQRMAAAEGHGFAKFAFADPIRREFMSIVGAKTEADYDRIKRSTAWIEADPGGHTSAIQMRDVMRGIGMLMRSYDENQFVEYVRKQILAEYQKHIRDRAPNGKNTYVCITDVRFANEVAMLHADFAATIIHIVNPNDKSADSHVTEQGLPPHTIDTVVENPRNDDLPIDVVPNRAYEFGALVADRIHRFVHHSPYN